MKNPKRFWLFAFLTLLILPLCSYGFSVGDTIDDGVGVDYTWGKYKLNLRVEDTHFVLYFINEEGKVVAHPDVEAVIRYENTTGKRISNIMRMESENDEVLRGSRFVAVPYNYWVFLTLKKEAESGDVLEVFQRVRLVQL